MKQIQQALVYSMLIVWTHGIVAVLHGLAHVGMSIWLSLFGDAFVTLVIGLAPFLALLLLRSRWQRSGALLLTLSMLGALIFGLWSHFIAPGTDNVAQMQPDNWYHPFLITSILLAILETTGVAIGLCCLSALSRSQYRTT